MPTLSKHDRNSMQPSPAVEQFSFPPSTTTHPYEMKIMIEVTEQFGVVNDMKTATKTVVAFNLITAILDVKA